MLHENLESNDQVSEQDKSPDIPHTVLNLCIHLIAHGSEGAQITHAHSIMGTANDKSYDATHDNLEDDTHQGIHQDSHHDSTPSAVILRLMLFRLFFAIVDSSEIILRRSF